jgi:hypothetical protein
VREVRAMQVEFRTMLAGHHDPRQAALAQVDMDAMGVESAMQRGVFAHAGPAYGARQGGNGALAAAVVVTPPSSSREPVAA